MQFIKKKKKKLSSLFAEQIRFVGFFNEEHIPPVSSTSGGAIAEASVKQIAETNT